jgi:serine protease AprX
VISVIRSDHMHDLLVREHRHTHSQNRFGVLPTAEKLGTDDRYSGDGVRIAFLDAGFYPHPDFASRVVQFHDIAGEERSLDRLLTPAAHHWHGTQTVTACAGDGRLSDGIYRGLAYRAELVLVKVSRAGRIGDAEIEAGLRWIVENRERLGIHILNISLGGDCDLPSASSPINSLIEDLTAGGIIVTVAAGNSVESRSAPPASAPSAITVGGYSDENQFSLDGFDLYHSSHGPTVDGLIKPEVIAPAMFVAAPILPGTPDYETAEVLSMLSAAPNYAFGPLLDESWKTAGLSPDVLSIDRESARQLVEFALHRRKIVATHYQHVDGTSFAAPIVASVIALMLEANPSLTPAAVKNVLVSTSKRLSRHAAIRQGFGVIDAPAAIEVSERERHRLTAFELSAPRATGSTIVFRFHDDSATSVSLAGDLTGWSLVAMQRCSDGLWEASIERRTAGKSRYKFLVDGERWIEDPSHGSKEEDGFGGFNSLLVIE